MSRWSGRWLWSPGSAACPGLWARPGRTGRSPGASFWLLFSSRSHRQLPGCFLPWPRSGEEVWVWSAGRTGMGPLVGHAEARP